MVNLVDTILLLSGKWIVVLKEIKANYWSEHYMGLHKYKELFKSNFNCMARFMQKVQHKVEAKNKNIINE